MRNKTNPVDALSKIQKAKMGKAVGSMLEGGRTKYTNDEPKPSATAAELLKGKEQFDKIQQYANSQSLYETASINQLRKSNRKPIKRGEMSQDKLDNIIAVKAMNLPWGDFKRKRK